MLRSSGLAALVLFVLFVLGGNAESQCIGSDQLDGGPCCAQAQPKLPNFPSFTQNSLEICWQGCNVSATINYRARWKNLNLAPSTGTPCGERIMQLDMLDAAGVLQWTGRMRLQYARTWVETDPTGVPLQVWRFLVNGDLSPLNASALVPCPAPVCAAAFNNRARFSGYIDYAANCAGITPIWQEAWMLTHACDGIDHQAGFPRGGAFHPDRSYSFVGPAAGFVPGPIQPVEGTPGAAFESLRHRNFPVPGTTGPVTCNFEERVAAFSLVGVQQCLCGAVGAPPQALVANLNVAGSCGTAITTPGGPLLPGYISLGIGAWTNPGVFPGVEVVRWTAGQYDQIDPCTGALRREVYFGATTLGGFPATQLLVSGLAGPLPPTFIDQSNSLRANGGLVMNIPYVSDRFLDLNH